MKLIHFDYFYSKNSGKMDFEIGDLVRYTFPEYLNMEQQSIVGHIEHIGEEHIQIKAGSILLKVSFKNFDNIEYIGGDKIYEEQHNQQRIHA